MNGKTMFDLSGKVCLVTGANRGLGRAIAIGLAEAGGDVVVACRDKESGRAVAREIERVDSGYRSMMSVLELQRR
jgi:NAD(P)-dependent dehydrogenase (short-subunit alcohol dehydrogenase family)